MKLSHCEITRLLYLVEHEIEFDKNELEQNEDIKESDSYKEIERDIKRLKRLKKKVKELERN